jgi:uncharacterized protein YbaA (DUF1428 family)
MAYIDGYVVAVPAENKHKYQEVASRTAKVFKEHGALRVVESWGDDVPEGKLTSFPMAVKAMDNEKVVFSWVLWPSREVRDQGMQKVMADPRMKGDPDSWPFDGKRMIFGGFEPIVDE